MRHCLSVWCVVLQAGVIMESKPLHGTLIVAIRCKEGLVIAADTRSGNSRRGFRDGEEKIVRWGGSGVLAFTGITGWSFEEAGHAPREEWFAKDLAMSYLHDKNPLSVDWKAFAQALTDGSVKRVGPVLPVSTEPTDLFGVGVWFPGPDSRVCFAGTQLRYQKDAVGRRQISADYEHSCEAFRPALYRAGSPGVVNEILDGVDSRFDDLRGLPLIRAIREKPLVGDLAVAEARDLAGVLIRAGYERSGWLGVNSDIGPSMDCLIIRNDGSVEWLDCDTLVSPN